LERQVHSVDTNQDVDSDRATYGQLAWGASRVRTLQRVRELVHSIRLHCHQGVPCGNGLPPGSSASVEVLAATAGHDQRGPRVRRAAHCAHPPSDVPHANARWCSRPHRSLGPGGAPLTALPVPATCDPRPVRIHRRVRRPRDRLGYKRGSIPRSAWTSTTLARIRAA
jgi:hypothetical protein